MSTTKPTTADNTEDIDLDPSIDKLAPDTAYDLFETIENSAGVCRNCFRVRSPQTTTEAHFRAVGGPSDRVDTFCECGCGTGQNDLINTDARDSRAGRAAEYMGTVSRLWSSHDITLPTRGSEIAFTTVLSHFLDRLEDLDISCDQEAAFQHGIQLKETDKYRSRDRDCLVAAVWHAIESPEEAVDVEIAAVTPAGLVPEDCSQD